MALICNMEENLFGIPAPSSYTVVTAVEVQKRDIMSVKNPDETPTLIAKHLLKFETKTYFSEASKNSTNPIATHGYTIPFEYAVTDNVVAYCYTFLKQNIGMFANATDA